MTIQDRIALLRRCMAHRGLTACVVVTDDFHGSEYVGDHFKAREYLSGFTGSAGTLAVPPSGRTGATSFRRNASWRAAVSS